MGNQSISSDNKGYAANYFEKASDQEVVAIFAQSSSGDISPHFHGPRQKKLSKDRRKKLKKTPTQKQKERIRRIIDEQFNQTKKKWLQAVRKGIGSI